MKYTSLPISIAGKLNYHTSNSDYCILEQSTFTEITSLYIYTEVLQLPFNTRLGIKEAAWSKEVLQSSSGVRHCSVCPQARKTLARPQFP